MSLHASATVTCLVSITGWMILFLLLLDVNGTLFVVVPVVSVRLGSIFLYGLCLVVLVLCTGAFGLGCFRTFVINYLVCEFDFVVVITGSTGTLGAYLFFC